MTVQFDNEFTTVTGQLPWQSEYGHGVPWEVELGERTSLLDLIDESARTWPNRVAVSCFGTDITYGTLHELSKNLASGFICLGVPVGARVALMMPSTPQYLICQIALIRAGMVAVNVNPLYTPRELLHQLQDCQASAIVVIENVASTLQIVLEQYKVAHVVVSSLGDTLGLVKGRIVDLLNRRVRGAVPSWHLPGHVRFRELMRLGASNCAPLHKPTLDGIAMLQYSGGTSGVPKAAILTNRNLLAAALQTGAFLNSALNHGKPIDAPVLVTPLPLYHVYTICITMMGLGIGCRVVLIPNPRDIGALVKTMRNTQFHLMTGLNTLYRALAEHPKIRKVDFSSCRVFIAGGTATRTAVAQQWHSITGKWITEGWGMSETTGSGTCNPTDRQSQSRGIGIPLPSTILSIRDSQGQLSPAGEPGEICISGPQVMAGYWGRQQETAEFFWPDGYFRTGDIGIMDDEGYFYIVDRLKDMALVSGFNVYPSEIEDVAVLHPDVLEAAAVAVTDDRTGEAIRLFVVPRNGLVTADTLKRHCAKLLTPYKRPRDIVFVGGLPKSAVGKILRRELAKD
jgi:long-chain acyl-CoA synthetase